MTVLVTGAAGFLGRATVRSLIARGYDSIRCLVRTSMQGTDLERLGGGAVHCQVGDLSSRSVVSEAVDGVDLVMHLAAGMRGTISVLFQNNVLATKNLLEAALESKRRPPVALVSSIAVYETSDLPTGAVIDENVPVDDNWMERDPYTQTKIWQEMLCRRYQESHSLRYAILRPGIIYGPGRVALSSRVGFKIGPFIAHFGGKKVVPMTFVDNCAEAVALAPSFDSFEGQAYNIVDDNPPTSSDLIHLHSREISRVYELRVPYTIAIALARANEAYSRRTRNQLPMILNAHKGRNMWKDLRYDNSRIKNAGWTQLQSTADALKNSYSGNSA